MFPPFQLKGHLFRFCKRCLNNDETTSHALCDCMAISNSTFHHLGLSFMEPGNYSDAPLNKILHLIQRVGLLRANCKGIHSLWEMVIAWGQFYSPLMHASVHPPTHLPSIPSFTTLKSVVQFSHNLVWTLCNQRPLQLPLWVPRISNNNMAYLWTSQVIVPFNVWSSNFIW